MLTEYRPVIAWWLLLDGEHALKMENQMKFNLTIKILLLTTISGCATIKDFTGIDVSTIDDIGSTIESVKMANDFPLDNDLDWTKVAKAGTEVGKAMALSDEDVRKASMQFSSHTDQSNDIAPSSSEYAQRLSSLTKDMRQEDDLNLNFKVYLSPEVNAFAYADGSIRVYSGLMDLLDDAELLAIVGHEIGHVKAGHSASRMRLALATSGLRQGAGAISGTAEVLADSSVVGGMVDKFINAQFSQANEEEADSYGAQLLARYGYNPAAAVSALQKLAKMEEDAGEDAHEIRFLSTHPAPGRRAVRLAAEIEEMNLAPTALARQDSSTIRSEEKVDAALDDLSNANQPSNELARVANDNVGITTVSTASQIEAAAIPKNRFYVQVSAFQNPTRAEERVATLASAGIPAKTQNAIVNGTQYVRVLVGPFDNRSNANAHSQQLQSLGILNEVPLVRGDL